jgi:hypothetical protein
MTACETHDRAILAGSEPDPAHLAGCARCRALYGRPRVTAQPPVPSVALFQRRQRRERASIGVALALAATMLWAFLSRPAPPEPDLLASLDDAETAFDVTTDDGLPGEAVVAELEPDDPFSTLDALTGEGSL